MGVQIEEVPAEQELIHHRAYDVQVFRVDESHMRIRGRVTDTKPDGLWFLDGDKPMVGHDMVVDLIVAFPTMEIVDAVAVMDTMPNRVCQDGLPTYKQLIGVSISRGYTHKVRDLFGGPRACTHITALLLAMGPAATQSFFGMQRRSDESEGQPVAITTRSDSDLSAHRMEQNREHFARNRNTCHVWADDGPMKQKIDAGEELEPPLWAIERMEELGLDPVETWRNAH